MLLRNAPLISNQGLAGISECCRNTIDAEMDAPLHALSGLA